MKIVSLGPGVGALLGGCISCLCACVQKLDMGRITGTLALRRQSAKAKSALKVVASEPNFEQRPKREGGFRSVVSDIKLADEQTLPLHHAFIL
jgi:hypothetical protein